LNIIYVFRQIRKTNSVSSVPETADTFSPETVVERSSSFLLADSSGTAAGDRFIIYVYLFIITYSGI
jgi:hypothetical protein